MSDSRSYGGASQCPQVKEIFQLVVLAAAAAFPFAVDAQTTPQQVRDRPIRAYVECELCDADHLREELRFVDLVRDRVLADVHALVTSLPTGSGGRAVTLEFAGKVRGISLVDTVLLSLRSDITDVERRHQLTRALKLGLMPFLRGHPVIRELDISYTPAATAAAERALPESDPWRAWVFKINGSASADGDDNYSNVGGSGGLTAGRVTDAIKVNLSVEAEYSRGRYRLEDQVLVSHRRAWKARSLFVRSYGEHWSAGISGSARSSIFENMALEVKVLPAIEYDVFPYASATQRQLIVRYGIGARRMRYVDTTIFGRLEESRPAHELIIATDIRRRWGTFWGTTGWSQYLHDTRKRRLNIDTGLDWRIVSGLSLNVGGSYSFIRDQLNLAGTNLSDEERLLRLRELQSGSRFSVGMGLSYTFGSVFNNVVNPRFRL